MKLETLPDLGLTPDLQTVWDATPNLQEKHEALRATTLGQYRQTMPEMQSFDPDTTIRFVDMHPDSADSATAIVVPFPFATGIVPHMVARMDMIQAASEKPLRLIALPNSALGVQTISLTRQERGQIASGDFTPYTDRALRTLDHLGVTRAHVMGYSQGGAIGAHLLGRLPRTLDGLASGLFDPPNMARQPLAHLTRGFVATGIRAVHRAMTAAQVPMILESVRAESRRQSTADLLHYAHAATTGINNALARGMARHAIADDLYAAADHGTPLTLMRGEKSTVTPAEPFYDVVERLVADYPDYIHHFEVPEVGHEVGDNIVIHGIMAVIALRNGA
ncbi:MAG: alpha/beta fold hydrolase [Candidatus Saccharibacteria bacterium]